MSAPTSILVIEDDELLREIYATKLTMEGFQVDTALDGLDGLDKATRSEPDIILLDMIMPRMTGLEFLAAYRQPSQHPRVKTVIISNKSSTKEMNQARALGVRDYLIKSQLTPQDIVTRVRGYLSE
jgi:two-component system, chemotaxis family, sensor histidine kinase and response regulator PixL